MIILPLYILIHSCLTKTSYLTFIGCHNARIQSCWIVVTTSVRAPSWHDVVCACTLTHFFPYPLHKFRLMLSFSYLWLWHIYVLTLYHFLSADYVRVRLVHFFSFFLHLHDVETFFCTVSFVSALYPFLSPSVSTPDSIIYPPVSMLDLIFLGLN